MEKESKKLESRQDVLDVFVEKGAIINKLFIKSIIVEGNRSITGTLMLRLNLEYPKGLFDLWSCSIETLLYSPESNFFDVMFPKTEKKEFNQVWHKRDCVTVEYPLQYLLDNLNETTS